MKIGILTFDDFTDLDLVLHWDLLSRVKYLCGVADWDVKILGTTATHVSMLGLPIPTHGSIDSLCEMDGVIISSGRGTRKLIQDQVYLKRLRLDPEKQVIGAQCSGALLLGELGFLRGVQVSAYPPIVEYLTGYGAELLHEGFVESGNIATASSCLAGQYLSEWLIKTLAGESAAAKVMESVRPI